MCIGLLNNARHINDTAAVINCTSVHFRAQNTLLFVCFNVERLRLPAASNFTVIVIVIVVVNSY